MSIYCNYSVSTNSPESLPGNACLLYTSIVISKVRYVIPEKDGLSIELDVFKAPYEGLLLAEVEFPTEEAAHAYQPPKWFGEDVTYSTEYHNSTLSKGKKR